jgi:hypothetical protein
MIYKAARGSTLTDEQAQQYGDHIAQTFSNGHLEVTPDDVVADAQAKSSPLHNFFEWDDSEAAQRYRVQQARYLLRSIRVVIEKQEAVTETRAFVRVTVQEPEQDARRVYTSVQHALSEDDLRIQVIEQALRQLESWRKRWTEYTELGEVFRVIDQARELVEVKKAA